MSRASAHAALGDEARLLIVDHLFVSDRSVAELSQLAGMESNLLAHHLDVLETAGLIRRRISEGDRRRRYVSLLWDGLPRVPVDGHVSAGSVAFVCTHNSARSQFAAALWSEVTGLDAASAGSEPAAVVHPKAVSVASEFGIDLSRAKPKGYERLGSPDLIVSVCDRARESGLPESSRSAHWSVPDPVLDGKLDSFRSAFGEIAERIEHLAQDDS